jgi:hypothetical protein
MAQVSFINRKLFKRRRDGQTASAVFTVDSGSQAAGVITSGGSAEDKVNRTGDTMTGDLIMSGAVIETDTINENTAGAGVNVDGALIKDGVVANHVTEAAQDGIGYMRKDGGWVNGGLRIDYSGGTGTQIDTINQGETIWFSASGAGLSTSYNPTTNEIEYIFTAPGGYYDGFYPDADTGDTPTLVGSGRTLTIKGGTLCTTDYQFNTPDHEITVNVQSDPSKVDISGDTMTGALTAPALTSTGDVVADTYFKSSDTSVIIGGSAAGVVYLRPNGHASSTGQLTVSTSQTTARTPLQVEVTGTTIATLVSTVASSYARMVVNAGASSDTQVAFMENGSTKWSLGNNADNDNFQIRKGFGAFGTDDYLRLDTSGWMTLGSTAIGAGAAPNQFTVDSSTGGNIGGAGAIGDQTGYCGINFYDGSVGDMRIWNKRAIDAFGNIHFMTGGSSPSTRMYVDYGGNIGIGTTAPGAKLDVHGSIWATGEVESYDTSDIRLKENVKNLSPERALRLLHARVIEYDHTEKGKHEIGLIAQEVQKIFPEVVKEDENGHLMIHYGKLVAALLSIIQSQEERLTKLEKAVFNGISNKQHQHQGRNGRAWSWKFWNK